MSRNPGLFPLLLCALLGMTTLSWPARAQSDTAAISRNDLMLIKVYQEDDLESTVRVSDAGTILFPLIGEVPAAGLTTQALAQRIAARLADGYLRNPQVTVTVTEANKRRFTVLGQVQKPGSYDMPDRDDLTLLQAVGMAGGYTSIANSKKVVLKRQIEGKETVYVIDAQKMAKGESNSIFKVRTGDVISVGERWF